MVGTPRRQQDAATLGVVCMPDEHADGVGEVRGRSGGRRVGGGLREPMAEGT